VLGAGTLADYLTKLLQTLFAVTPATTAPNADPRVAIRLGDEFPLFGWVALADLASGLAGQLLAFAAANPLRAAAGRAIVGLTLYANAGMPALGALALYRSLVQEHRSARTSTAGSRFGACQADNLTDRRNLAMPGNVPHERHASTCRNSA